MKSQHVLPIQPESFVVLVKFMKAHLDKADIFEVWLDHMKVKGDLAVIQKYFNKPIIGKSEDLDMLKRAIKAGLTYVDVPHEMAVDLEFETLRKNKGSKVIRSYHNYTATPSYDALVEILEDMRAGNADYLKVATHINEPDDADRLMQLLEEPHYHGVLIVTGMGDNSRRVRIEAPLKGSVFYYAPIDSNLTTAPGQLSRDELEREWDML